MKKLYILPLLMLFFASCENYYLEQQLGYQTTITDVRNFNYSLTAGDYSAIASNPTNIATALAMGTEEGDSSVYFLLRDLGTRKYFADTVIVPEIFIPAFLATKYPQLSNGTICEVTYNTLAEKPAYMNSFRTIRDFTSPTQLTSVEQIPDSMEQYVNAYFKKEGNKFIVHFTDQLTYLYQYADGQFSAYVNDQIDIIALTKADYQAIGAANISEPEVVLPIYLKQRFPYATADTKLAVVYKGKSGNTITEATFDGNAWSLYSDLASEVMSFEMKDQWKANLSTYLFEPFIAHGQGNFVIQNVSLQEPLTYTWYYSATYGMCSSAYKDGASYQADTWLISPEIKLKKAVKPQLVFDQAFNKATNFTEECHVMVSTDYKDDVTKATWTELKWNVNEDGTLNVPPGTSWVFQTSGNLDLSEWAGESIYLGFNYTTGPNEEGVVVSGTWELQNVLVFEPEE